MKQDDDGKLDQSLRVYNRLPSNQNLPRVASLIRPIHSPLAKPKVDLTKITSDNLPRVASISIQRYSPRKKEVNLLSISSENLPRVASLKKSGSVSPTSRNEIKVRDRMGEATKGFVAEFEVVNQGLESPGPQRYALSTSTIGNPN